MNFNEYQKLAKKTAIYPTFSTLIDNIFIDVKRGVKEVLRGDEN